MSENHREPEVLEARVPVVECLDGPARITSKELAPIHSVKSGILRNACSTSPRVVALAETKKNLATLAAYQAVSNRSYIQMASDRGDRAKASAEEVKKWTDATKMLQQETRGAERQTYSRFQKSSS